MIKEIEKITDWPSQWVGKRNEKVIYIIYNRDVLKVGTGESIDDAVCNSTKSKAVRLCKHKKHGYPCGCCSGMDTGEMLKFVGRYFGNGNGKNNK